MVEAVPTVPTRESTRVGLVTCVANLGIPEPLFALLVMNWAHLNLMAL